MSASVPGILISRNGEVRRYVGHSKRTGTLLGVTSRNGSVWKATCAGCGYTRYDTSQRDTVYSLKYHWDDADAAMAATHREDIR